MPARLQALACLTAPSGRPRVQVRALQPQALAAWWQQGHPGWAIYPVDSEQFLSTGALEGINLPLPGDAMLPAGAASGAAGSAFAAPPPMSSSFLPPSDPAAAAAAAVAGAFGAAPTPPLPAGAATAFNPALASALMSAAGAAGGLQNDALLRAMSPLMHGGGPAGQRALG